MRQEQSFHDSIRHTSHGVVCSVYCSQIYYRCMPISDDGVQLDVYTFFLISCSQCFWFASSRLVSWCRMPLFCILFSISLPFEMCVYMRGFDCGATFIPFIPTYGSNCISSQQMPMHNFKRGTLNGRIHNKFTYKHN